MRASKRLKLFKEQAEKQRAIAAQPLAVAIRVFIDKINPFMSKSQKVERILRYMNYVRDDVRIGLYPLAENITFTKEQCEKYKNAEKQTDDIIVKYPKLLIFKHIFRDRVKYSRKKYR